MHWSNPSPPPKDSQNRILPFRWMIRSSPCVCESIVPRNVVVESSLLSPTPVTDQFTRRAVAQNDPQWQNIYSVSSRPARFDEIVKARSAGWVLCIRWAHMVLDMHWRAQDNNWLEVECIKQNARTVYGAGFRTRCLRWKTSEFVMAQWR